MAQLSGVNLATLHADVRVPAYERGAVNIGVVHFGVGSFHRAHQARYFDDLLATDDSWGICGVGLLPGDVAMREALHAQEGLYTLVTKSPDGTSRARVIGSLVEYLFAPEQQDAVLDRLTDPAVRVVTLTITEGGYNVSDRTGLFDPTRPDIAADIRSPRSPNTVFGFVTEALRRRRDAGLLPPVILSCDNLESNGKVAREAFTAFARAVDADLAEWISTAVDFPSTMVDGITPVTTPELVGEASQLTGVDDAWPVITEDYTQWVIERTTTVERLPLEAVGAQYVDDVAPWEFVKLRLLNGAHQVMSYLGILAGHRYVHEVCDDPEFSAFIRAYLMEEAAPTLEPPDDVDPAEYISLILRRFRNHAVADTLARQTVDGSQRLPKFVLPVIRERLEAGEPIGRAALVVAGWSAFLAGGASGDPGIAVTDSLLDVLLPLAATDVGQPGAILSCAEVFGDLASSEEFRVAYVAARTALKTDGVRLAVSKCASF